MKWVIDDINLRMDLLLLHFKVKYDSQIREDTHKEIFLLVVGPLRVKKKPKPPSKKNFFDKGKISSKKI